MFTWVGQKFDAILATYVLDVVTALMVAITPLALTAMTLWVALYGWAVLRHDVGESVPTLLWKVFKIGLILAFALQAGFYIANVADTAKALALGVARTFLPAGVDPATVATPYAILDHFNDMASAQVADIMKEAGMFRLDLFLAAGIFALGSVIFLCIALFIVTLSTLLLTFVLGVGPLFILCLAWRPTQRFFDSWLSMVLNAVVLTWFAFFALGLSAFMGLSIFDAIKASGGFLDGSLNVLGEAIRYCVLMVLMAILCFQAPALASALTGGPAVQQGFQMIQSAVMFTSLRSASSARAAAPAAGSAGGVIRPGAGVAHAAGRATGAAALAGARFAGTMATGAGAIVRQGYVAARSAAYRLAALRGTA